VKRMRKVLSDEGMHRRTPEIVANLYVGCWYFLCGFRSKTITHSD